MTEDQIEAALNEIRVEKDANLRNLRVAKLVSTAFREIGCEPVIVGGSAVEFYSEGRYVSGGVDVCYSGGRYPSPRERTEVMSRFGKALSSRKWDVCGVFVDLLGRVETSARTPFQEIEGLSLIQIENLVPERFFVAIIPQPNEERLMVAKMLLALALTGGIPVDNEELERVADSPDYRVGDELRAAIAELFQPKFNL